jgi:predicted nucleic acid-binding protein
LRFWDSSAVVPLLVEQQASSRVSSWLAEDPTVVVWTLTPVEVVSALRRLTRETGLEEKIVRLAEARLGELIHASHVLVDVEPTKALAIRLLRVHPLRAFDALQLGAAMHWAEGHPDGRGFYTLDARLALAARREGFLVPD